MNKRTALYQQHISLGAKFIPFGEWEMPIQYSSIITEHNAVRESAGLFDASHMGEIRVVGKGAMEGLNHIITNDLCALAGGKAMYTFILNEQGGVLDDLLVYNIKEDEFLLVVNAQNTDKVYSWLRSKLEGAQVLDESGTWSLLALQGPASPKILEKYVNFEISLLKPFSFCYGKVSGKEALVSRTGYTGEEGFEIYLANEDAAVVWESLLEDSRVLPAGLGARDTLRLEAGLPLYGNELSEDITPLDAGLMRFVKTNDKNGASPPSADFIGKSAIEAQVRHKWLAGIELIEKGIPRSGCVVFKNGEKTGHITSGTHSPTLKKGIGMAYLSEKLDIGAEVYVLIRDKKIKGTVVKLPFYKRKRGVGND